MLTEQSTDKQNIWHGSDAKGTVTFAMTESQALSSGEPQKASLSWVLKDEPATNA